MQRSDTAQPPAVHATHVHTPDIETRDQRPKNILKITLLALFGFLAVSLGLLAWYTLSHDGRVYKGVSVLGTSLGGLTHAEAQAALTEAATGYPTGAVSVSGAGKTWHFSPADLGVALDVERTLDAAFGVGRSGDPLGDLGTQLGSLTQGAEVAPLLKSDSALIEAAAARIASELDRPAVDSQLRKSADGVVMVTPSASGLNVDRQKLSADIAAAISAEPFGTVEVHTQVHAPKITESDLEGTKAQALLLTEQPITLTSGEQTWTLETEDLRRMLAITHNGASAEAALAHDEIARYLAPLAEALYAEPVDAAITIGKSTVTLDEDQPGQNLDVEAAASAIQQAAASQDAAGRTLDLPVREIAAGVRTEQLQAIYEKTSALVANGVRVRYGEDTYIMRSSSVTGFVSIEAAQGGPGQMVIRIDEDVLAERISGIATTYVNRQPSDARFRMSNGAPTKVADAAVGLKVDIDGSVANVVKALETYAGSGTMEADLVVATTEPSTKNADMSAINTPDMLAYGQTSYATSSANRKWNVELGARSIDGTLVPPGAIFSTVDTIGPLTLDAGFKMGFGIVGDGRGGLTTVPSEAGGICQVSTTLFHAVFRGGLEVVERNWHSYWINLYGVAPTGLQGLDATIAPPYKDFRFKNNTGNWLLVKAVADGKNLTFQLWGVNPGWSVSIGKPVITNRRPTSQKEIVEYSADWPASSGKVKVENAQDGFDASISRVVKDANGNVLDSWTARSTYQPAYNRYLIGTGR
ncbi:MAG: peptidoglycan binding domain-containing protein [Chloroflexia bacterium]